MFDFPLGKDLEMELMGQRVDVCLALENLPEHLSVVAVFPSHTWWSRCPTSWKAFGAVNHFILTIPTGVKRCLTVPIFIVLMTNSVEPTCNVLVYHF
jgi:hypothetical protein